MAVCETLPLPLKEPLPLRVPETHALAVGQLVADCVTDKVGLAVVTKLRVLAGEIVESDEVVVEIVLKAVKVEAAEKDAVCGGRESGLFD